MLPRWHAKPSHSAERGPTRLESECHQSGGLISVLLGPVVPQRQSSLLQQEASPATRASPRIVPKGREDSPLQKSCPRLPFQVRAFAPWATDVMPLPNLLFGLGCNHRLCTLAWHGSPLEVDSCCASIQRRPGTLLNPPTGPIALPAFIRTIESRPCSDKGMLRDEFALLN
jgi:hypothetical protein